MKTRACTLNRSNEHGADLMKRSYPRAILLSWVIAGGMAACAGDVVDIDRTQANKVSKSIFEGEWYYRATLIDNQFTQTFVFEGAEGSMDRIRWEIREHELIAYRSWKQLEDAEDGNGDLEFHGPPVASFAISSHFDVKRQYNPATGEQSNVIEENTTDRPWFERDFMRVDWSQNLVNDPWSTLEGYMQFVSGAPYYIQEHEVDNPHRAEVGAEAINVVNNYLVTTDLQTCYYALLDPYFCGTTHARVKLSFRKLDTEQKRYQPQYYPDSIFVQDDEGNKLYDVYGDPHRIPVFQRFGFFRVERRAYDHEYQWTRNGRIFLAKRWNLWQSAYDALGEVMAPQFRKPRKITYHTNAMFPEDSDVWQMSQKLVSDWDQTFRETVAMLKRGEQINIGALDLAAVANADVTEAIFELNRNSCNVEGVSQYAQKHALQDALASYGIDTVQRGNLLRACAVLEWASKDLGPADRFSWQKQGDLRHSFLHWVDKPQQAGLLGYGPSAADPVTGEIISANANVYGGSVDSFAAFAADVVALINGDLELDDLTLGEHVRDHLAGRQRREPGHVSGAKLAAQRERFERSDAMFNRSLAGRPEASAALGVAKSEVGVRARIDAEMRERARPVARAKLARLKRSPLERELLVNDDLKRALLGPDRFMPGAGDSADLSPIGWMLDEADLGRKHREAIMKFARNSVMITDWEEWTDEGMVSLADELKGMSWEEIFAFMRRGIYRGVMAHEVGHTLGLRHNFEGSFDALNFHPEFWSYYDPDTRKVERVDADGHHNRAERLMYSSIMDYASRFYGDNFEGLGPYDHAAIHFGYGNIVEVFDPNVVNLWVDQNTFWLHGYEAIPQLLSGEYTCQTGPDCPEVVREGFIDEGNPYQAWHDGCYERPAEAPELTPDERAECNRLEEMVGRYQLTYLRDATQGTTGRPENLWKRSYVYLNDIKDWWLERGYNVFSEVPYLFCPDEWSWESNVTCQPWDKGATFSEIIDDRFERYDKYYYFSNFKRDRFAFNDWSYTSSYMNRLLGRYLGPMSNVYRYYLTGFRWVGYDRDGESLYFNDFPIGRDWQVGAMEGLNRLVSVIEQPEPGSYCYDGTTNTYRPWPASAGSEAGGCDDLLEVPIGVGKHYYTNWTDEYYYKATRIGTFFDKYIALWALTDNEGYFYQNFDDLLDAGAFALSYWRGLQEEMLDVFEGVYTGRESKFAWRYDPQADQQQFVPPPVVDIYKDTPDYETLPKIESATSWTLRYYGVILPMARFNSYYDYTQDFSNYGRICLEGYIDCLDYTRTVEDESGVLQVEDAIEGIDYTAFVDPMSGFKYTAPMTSDVRGAHGAMILDAAKRVATEEYEPARQAWELAKTSYEQAVAAVAAGDAAADVVTPLRSAMLAAEAELEVVERELSEHTAFIDVIRRMSYLMEYGG